jgi:hypothetical protein
MKKIIYILAMSVAFACNSGNKSGFITPENDEFASFLKHFKQAELPMVIKGCYEDIDGLTEFDGSAFSTFTDAYHFAYRQIPSNGDYIAVITLQTAECFIPVLTTFKPNGTIIDRKVIAIGQCWHDCGYECEEYMTIKSDYSIYTSDTITSCECDEMWEIIPETCQDFVIFKEGKLNNDGKIELSDETKKSL